MGSLHGACTCLHAFAWRRHAAPDLHARQRALSLMHARVHACAPLRAGVWPTLLQYFYTDEVQLTDETVLPLLAMARELMVKSIEVGGWGNEIPQGARSKKRADFLSSGMAVAMVGSVF